MAENTATGPLQQLTNVSQLHIVRQLVLLAGLAGSIALGVAVVLWAQDSDYRLLYSGLAAEDNAAIAAALDQSGLSYRIDRRSGEITVPDNELHSTRLLLSRAGLPQKSSSSAASILYESPEMGTSTTIERARLVRALQEELEQTIESTDSVIAARVHLSIPKRTGFLRSSAQAAASVTLKLVPGTGLGDMQIAGFRHLVASSDSGLDSERVSIIDHHGNLLSGDADSRWASSSRQMRLKGQLNEEYARRIVSILTPILGPGRVHAEVDVDMDFSDEETTREDVSPDSVVISEQTAREETTEEDDTGGVPGLLEDDLNAGPDGLEPEPTTLREKTSSTRNFDVGRTIKHTRRSGGGINRITVGVVIDYPEAESAAEPAAVEATQAGDPQATGAQQTAAPEAARNHDQLIDLVKQTIGFNEARGDSVSLVDSDFYRVEEVFAPTVAPGILENPLFWKGLRYGGAGLAVLFIIFGVLRPVLKSSVALNNNLPGRNPAGLAYADGTMPEGYEGFDGEDQVTLTGGNPANRLAAPNAARRYENNLAQVRAIVESEPDRAARVIQGWVADD